MLAHGAAPPAPSLPAVLARWSFEPLVVVAVGLAALLYLRGVATVRRRHPANPFPRGREAAFLSGLGVIVLALASPIAAYDGALFSFHMVQHVLLVMVAAPLLLLGAPVTLALRSAPAPVRRAIHLALGSVPVRFATHPAVTWTLFATVMWGSHFSGLFEAALESGSAHQAEHALYLGSALLFWWNVLGVDPAPRRLSFPARALYLFLAMPQNTFLSLAIFSAGRVRYEHYATIGREWGASPLSDQHTAGGIMWVAGDLVFLVGVIVLMAMWARHEERMNVVLDARLDLERAGRSAQARTSLSSAMDAKRSPR